MNPRVPRVILAGLCPAYLLLYVVVLGVAFITSGHQLLRQPGAWYAAVAPLAYVGLVGAYAFGIVCRPMSTATLFGVHVVVLPALVFSFVGLGVLLPAFAGLWWWMRRAQAASA